MIDLLSDLTIHTDWEDFLTPNRLSELHKIGCILENEFHFTPSSERVLHFLSLSLQKMKAVVLGQDPYPQIGIASGRAFEVLHLNDWKQSFRNTSLQNIIRAVVKTEHSKLLKFNEIRKLLDTEIFLLPPNLLFKDWEDQGVLLLNTSFTCAIDRPNSHASLWERFTAGLLEYIQYSKPEILWFLWGEHARHSIAHLGKIRSIYRYHPSRCSPREKDFLYSNPTCFEESGLAIQWSGRIEA